ncbi:hypothetical protein JCM8547_004531 [Rhodosporidiobolus lusitaniae]
MTSRPAFDSSPSDSGPAAFSSPPAASSASPAPAGQAVAISASSPPSPTVAHLPDGLPSGLIGVPPSSSSSTPADALRLPPPKSTVVGVERPSSIAQPIPGQPGLDSLHSLYSALPTESNAAAAAYSPDGYEGAGAGFYGVNGYEEGWDGAALGLSMGPAVSFANGEKRTGACKFFNAQKGFGFILDDHAEDLGGDEIFVHYTAIAAVQGGPGGFRSLLEGEAVEYSLMQGPKGWQAQQVTGPNGAACIGTPPGVSSSKPPISYDPARRSSIYETRNSYGRRPSGATGSIPTTPARNRNGSAHQSSASGGGRSTYSSPANRSVHLPACGGPALGQPFPIAQNCFQPYVVFPYGGSPLQHPSAMLHPFPPDQQQHQQNDGENLRPSQPGQPPPGVAYYATQAGLPAPPGAVAAQGVPDPRFFLPPHGYAVPAGVAAPPSEAATSGSSYSSVPYPISSAASSLGGTHGPPSAYPISSSSTQTSPAGHFLLPYPPPPPQQFYPHLGGAPPPPPQPYAVPPQQQQPPASVYPISSAALPASYDPSAQYAPSSAYGYPNFYTEQGGAAEQQQGGTDGSAPTSKTAEAAPA